MKYITFVLLIALCSCKQTKKSLDDFDMSTYCGEYTILKFSSNKTCYVFIKKGEDRKRFVIFKDYDYKNSGYGYLYNDYIDASVALKHGVFSSARSAIREAESKYEKDHMTFGLMNIVPNGGGEWLNYGQRLFELCPDK